MTYKYFSRLDGYKENNTTAHNDQKQLLQKISFMKGCLISLATPVSGGVWDNQMSELMVYLIEINGLAPLAKDPLQAPRQIHSRIFIQVINVYRHI